MNIILNVNNGMHLELTQDVPDGMIEARCMVDTTVENTFTVSASDMVTLFNWFRWQKDNGNINLEF